MGIFGGDRPADEVEALQQQLREGEAKRKVLATALAEERKQTAALRIELGKANGELAAARRAVAKARQRQKASVERANRFKAKLDNTSGEAQIS
jgi:chromosome segregation ATPase